MSFRAFRIANVDNTVRGALVDMTLDELSAGDVLIRAVFSSVNYKDALAGTGTGKILRRFPLVGGIDVAGIVESSTDERFTPGAEVLVTGYDLGVNHDGGYAGYVRVPADWVVPIPVGLTLFEAMALGTAGFTAGLAVIRLEQMGLRPGRGPVLVTGATGGVGSVAIASLARLGYEVTALSGKESAHDYLKSLGATAVLNRTTLEMGTRPLEKATWAGAVDPPGGLGAATAGAATAIDRATTVTTSQTDLLIGQPYPRRLFSHSSPMSVFASRLAAMAPSRSASGQRTISMRSLCSASASLSLSPVAT